MNPRLRPLILAVVVIAAIWLCAWAGLSIARNSKVTAEKVSQYVDSTDLDGLSPAARAAALHKLERMINNLSLEERRKWRREGPWRKWFDEMTEAEKGGFIEQTMPSGFKQWLNAFDELPPDRRRQFIDELLAHLKNTHRLMTDREPGETNSMFGTNGPPILSAELERKARTIGLKTFYTESSAETKAELAPALEELQLQMERGKYVR